MQHLVMSGGTAFPALIDYNTSIDMDDLTAAGRLSVSGSHLMGDLRT